MKRSITILLLQCLFILSSRGQSMTPAFGFEENKGQIRNQHWQPRPDVLFSGSSSGLNFHIRKDGISFQINSLQSNQNDCSDTLLYMSRVDMNWVDANSDFEWEWSDELGGYNNYYNVPLGNQPALFVKKYKSVTIKSLWQGVDLHCYINTEGQLETDWQMEKAIDHKQIAFTIEGAEVDLSDNKYLVMQTPLGTIREGELKVYQSGKQIEAWWQQKDNIYSFELGKHDPSLALCIDPPTLLWATYYGGIGQDIAHAVAIDDTNDKIYFTGITASINQIASNGAFKDSIDGQRDAMLVKFDSSGNRLWGTYYGGEKDEFNYAIAIYDSTIIIGGMTRSSTNIATMGAYQVELKGTSNAYFVKINSHGIRHFASYFGGDDNEGGRDCLVDNFGNIYIAGYSWSSGALATSDACSQQGDVFLAKFDSSGSNLLWCTKYGGGGSTLFKMQWDKKGNIYLTGNTISTTGVASANAHQTQYGGHTTLHFGDAFLAKFDSSGQCLWSTYYGGTHDDGGTGLTVDQDNNVYLIGGSGSEDVIATVGSHQVFLNKIQLNPHVRTADGFVAKFNEDGKRLWGTYFGDTLSEHFRGACFDDSGNIYLVGETNSPKGIATPWAHQTILKGLRNGLVVKMDTSGQVLWSTYFGGILNDRVWDCACDNKGNLYITGNTSSETEFATPGAHQEVYGKGGDAFLAKIDARGRYNIRVLQIGFSNQFTLYPNPTNSELTLERQENFSNTQVSIHDIKGRLVYQSNWKQGEEKHSINTSGWLVGIYYVTLQSVEGEKTVRKLMIVR